MRIGIRVQGFAPLQQRMPHQTPRIRRLPQSFLLFHTVVGHPIRNDRRGFSTTPNLSAVPAAVRNEPPLPASSSQTEITTITLHRTIQSKSFRNGNQLVFTKAIQGASPRSIKLVEVGDLVRVAVQDEKQGKDLLIGWGVYNEKSLYKIRILCHRFLQPTLFATLSDAELTNDERLVLILTHQIQRAYDLRRHILNLPNASTDTYRLIHGEGDQLSGLAVDIVGGNHAVVMSGAAWCEVHRECIYQVLENVLPDGTTIHWQRAADRLKQDSYSVAVPVEGVDHTAASNDELVVSARENTIEYESYPASSSNQKTGVYCDQRENRLLVARHCRGKRVLDLCCFHGGFSLHAAKLGEAMSCLGVDSSAAAIATARANAIRNGVAHNVQFVQSDITPFLQSTDQQFDVVILDPPKLAPSAKVLEKAPREYHALNRDAVRAVDDAKGGLLLTCTCSSAMTQEEGGQYFLRMVQAAALAAGKQITLLSVQGAAPCHTIAPISFPAGAYLTAALFYVHPVDTNRVTV
jgi:23S rRNA (cytosine1962-C5)-methyltransferase